MVHLNFQLDCKFENKDGSFEFYWVTESFNNIIGRFPADIRIFHIRKHAKRMS
jgi:hypothetical protein